MMDGDKSHLRSPPTTQTKTLTYRHHRHKKRSGAAAVNPKAAEEEQEREFSCVSDTTEMNKKSMSTISSEAANGTGDHNAKSSGTLLENAYFMRWRMEDALNLVRYHLALCVLAACVLFFMGVEYTLRMIPYSSPPFDLGFVVTVPLNRLLASRPFLNNFLAGLNTVFVGMQTAYILGTWLLEGRPRATISAIFMFTCRGILGYVTQLPVPQDFLGSGVDFPVGNVSFFLFYSGHVAASVIASLDMKRMQRWELAWTFDTLNFLQIVRLLSTRGHYTIDLVVGVGAGMVFDSMAGKYLESKKKEAGISASTFNGYSALYSL